MAEQDHVETGQSETDRQGIREAIAHRIAMDRQHREQQARAQQQQVRAQRVAQRKKKQGDRDKQEQQRRMAALNRSREKTQGHVSEATKALQKALRAAQEVPLNRHSDEGREQEKLLRKISSALSALGSMGRIGLVSED